MGVRMHRKKSIERISSESYYYYYDASEREAAKAEEISVEDYPNHMKTNSDTSIHTS